MMKRTLSRLIPLVLVAGVAACGDAIGPAAPEVENTRRTQTSTTSAAAVDRVILATFDFTRSNEAPATSTGRFDLTNPEDYEEVRLSVTSRESPSGQPLTRAEVRFNGELVWSQLEIAKAVTIDVPQSIGASNTVSVGIWGPPGSGVSIEITARKKALAWRVLANEYSGPQPNGSAAHNSAIYLPEEDAVLVVEQAGDYVAGKLWRFSLATKTWTQVPAVGWPLGKFRDYVLDPIRNEIVVSWDGIGQVWALPVGGGTWTLRHDAANWDTHYIGSFFFDRGRNRLSHLFGYGFGTYRADYHFFESGVWQSAPIGGDAVWARIPFCTTIALNDAGTAAYFSGGYGDANPAQQDPEPIYDDLIRFDVTTLQHTYLAPRRHRAGIDRLCSAVAVAGNRLYRWGGTIFTSDDPRNPQADPTDELQLFDGSEWRTLPVENRPAAAWHRATLFYDARRGDLVQVGGWNGSRWVFAIHAVRID